MNRSLAPLIALFGIAACSDDTVAPFNPDKLWLGLDGSEVQVKLVPAEPDPF
jgi:hypothetical protein